MRNWTIKPVLPGKGELPRIEPPDASPSDRPSIDQDAGKFEDLMNVQDLRPSLARRPSQANGPSLTAPNDAPFIEKSSTPGEEARATGDPTTYRGLAEERLPAEKKPERCETSLEAIDVALAGAMPPPRTELLRVAAPVETPDAAPIAYARMEVVELVNRLADRIVVEGPTSRRPVVEIHLAEDVLPDTVVRVTRSADRLEVSLTTLHAEAHNALNQAIAGLGERLVALEGGLPVLITLSMQGVATSELSFGDPPGQPRYQAGHGQRKKNHGRS